MRGIVVWCDRRERGFSLCFCDFLLWKVAFGFLLPPGCLLKDSAMFCVA